MHQRVTGKRVIHTETHAWNFEYCNACAAHIRTWPTPIGAGGCLLTLFTCGIAGLVLLIMKESAKSTAKRMCGPQCVGPGPCVSFVNWHGTVKTFSFTNLYYAGEFMIANVSHLVNLDPSQRNWLEGAMAARGQLRR